MSNTVHYVYICAAGHSGSTLLDLLIGSHRTAISLGEISHLPKNLALNTDCTCGVPVRCCEFWREVVSVLGRRLDIDIVAAPYALNLGYPKAKVIVDRTRQTAAYALRRQLLRSLGYIELRFEIESLKGLVRPLYESIENNLLLYDVIREIHGVDMTIDSSKDYLKAIGLYKRRPQNVRILFLTRDGRGVFYSNIRRRFSRRASAYGWKHYYARALPLLKKHVDEKHVLHLKYEALTSNPRLELQRICDFLSIEFQEKMLDYAAQSHHLTNGNNTRFRANSDITPDLSWQQKLSTTDRRYFERIAGDLNRQFGYL